MNPIQGGSHETVQMCINEDTGLPQTFSADYYPASLSAMIRNVVDTVVEYFPVELAASAGMMFAEVFAEALAEGLLTAGDDDE
jgi:hypothetical protein